MTNEEKELEKLNKIIGKLQEWTSEWIDSYSFTAWTIAKSIDYSCIALRREINRETREGREKAEEEALS